MNNNRRHYQHYHTKNNASIPLVENIYDGEIAVNMSDGDEQLFIKNTNNQIINFKPAYKTGNIISEIDEDIVLDDVDTNTYVKYVAQTLTEEQKAQVRTNINALSENNIKTINGESIVGSGNITISGGGSSSGGSVYSEVSHGTADTTFTLTPNTFHIWNEVNSLTLTLGAETIGVANEYLFQFTSGSEPTTLSLPDDIKWTGGETPTIEANKIYQISILKGLGSVLEWDSKSMIIFTVTKTTTSQTFSCESGMTWEEFINSEYSNNTFTIYTQYNNQIRWTDDYAYCVVGVSPSSVIENNMEYTSKYGD